jgi:hypothetical protein
MTVTTASALQSEEIKPEIGSRICNSKDELLGGGLAAELRGLLERRGVLVFPEVGFTPGELVDFTATLGDYFPDTPSGAALTLSYDPETNPSAEYIKGSFYWHFDGYMNEVPILASILTAEVLAPWGGETEFANTYAAWEQLPAERQAQIEHLRAVHAMAQAQLAVEPEPSYETFLQWLKVPSRELPLVDPPVRAQVPGHRQQRRGDRRDGPAGEQGAVGLAARLGDPGAVQLQPYLAGRRCRHVGQHRHASPRPLLSARLWPHNAAHQARGRRALRLSLVFLQKPDFGVALVDRP